MNDERTFFLCSGKCVKYKDLYLHPHSHIIGELRHLTDGGRRVTALAVYETTVRADQVPPLKPEIRMCVIGDARMIKCKYIGCDQTQRWDLGRAGILSLMARLGIEDKYLETEQESMYNKS